MNKIKTGVYVEGALVIAMSTILSFVVIFKLPWGGEITLLNMLPISIYSIKYGLKKGIEVSFVFSLLRLIQGIGSGLFAWGLTPMMLISCILLDYILAFTVIGASGMFRKKGIYGWLFGTFATLLMRFACHYISGAVIFHSAGMLWDGFAIDNIYLYSLLYNGCYMLPEIIFTCIGTAIMFKVPIIRKQILNC